MSHADAHTHPPRSGSGKLSIKGVRKNYGDTEVLANIDLELTAGEFLTILGPSGSGKTTLLKIVAGFEREDDGEILLDDTDIAGMDPAHRNIGMVFQNYALFPHMTVTENVAFPLRMRKIAKAEINRRTIEALELVKLGDFGDRLPKQLSGGQQQRVALARAVVYRPALLLLDEPFGALDRKLREEMQLEVRGLQRQLGLTTLFITHDQEEALVMSDRIGIINRGKLEQVGLPSSIYEAPASEFVAKFIGESNILTGVVESDAGAYAIRIAPGVGVHTQAALRPEHLGKHARILVRPERISTERRPGGERYNEISAQIVELIYIGTAIKCRLRTENGGELLARFPVGRDSRTYSTGDKLSLVFRPEDTRVIHVG